MIKPTRRAFLVAGAATGAGLAGAAIFGVGVLAGVDTDGLTPVLRDDGAVGLNAWIEIHPDGRIVLAAPRVEMGQGAQTGLAMLMAEELEVSPSATNVEVRHPVEKLPAYANFALGLGARPEEASGPVHWASEKVFGLLPMIATGGSTSIVDGFVSMRIAGASAREMLRGAAAELWGAPLETCAAEDGFIVERGSNRRASYGELAAAASRRRPPTNPSLKPPRDWRLIGTDQVRMDADDKARGASVFGVDVALDGMLYAAIRHADVMGARVLSFDPAPAHAAPGVVEVVDLGDAVAVIADSYHRAQRGLDALSIQFGGDDALSTEEISKTLRAALTDKPGHTFAAEGDIRDALKSDDETGANLDAVYETPFLPHLCMEPMNATARFEDGVLEIWAPTQSPLTVNFAGREIGAKKTICHTTFAGGGFGRRAEMDFALEVARLAKAVPGRPVKLIWSRSDDIARDAYRPAAAARVRGRLGDDGLLRAFDFKAATPSVGESFSRRNLPFAENGAKDRLNVEGADTVPYTTQSRLVSAVAVETPVPVGYWRSVGHSNNAFFTESFINEAAHAAGADPIAFRRRHLQGSPRLLGVLDALEAASGWGAEAAGGDDAEGWRAGAGVAIHASFRSFVGFVVEVLVSPQREIRLRRIICAADCGVLVNPDQVRAQMEGSAIFALSAALWHEVEIVGGRVTQSNFDGAPLLTLAQTPQIDVRLIESDAPPGGAGEPGVPPVAPALAAAIFAATGDRVRRLPVARAGYAVGSAVF